MVLMGCGTVILSLDLVCRITESVKSIDRCFIYAIVSWIFFPYVARRIFQPASHSLGIPVISSNSPSQNAV